ncbi:hypothetical protein OQJ40_27225 [Serratia nevei]|uniref:hypothetical protein n=1 Tax=Serratia nevei TaxID=2703794 RepID=UPI0027D2B8AB|nr:hypothetical protein [Serratia nevei]WMC78457.1 hypothetical protein O8I25_26970 [Serratia nevei]WMC83887.1 hypothetical protein O8I24_27210 [Serratia nevei]
MGDWFIATEGVKIVKDSPGLWPQIITGVLSAGAALVGVWLTHYFARRREERAAAAKLGSERFYIAMELVFLLERFAQHCALAAIAEGEFDPDGKTEVEYSLPAIDYESIAGDWRSLPPELMYRLGQLSVLSHEAVVAVNVTFHEDTPYSEWGVFELHSQAARMGLKAIRLSRSLRKLCDMPQDGLSADFAPTRRTLLQARGKDFHARYKLIKEQKKNEQEINDYLESVESSERHNEEGTLDG